MNDYDFDSRWQMEGTLLRSDEPWLYGELTESLQCFCFSTTDCNFTVHAAVFILMELRRFG